MKGLKEKKPFKPLKMSVNDESFEFEFGLLLTA